MNREEAKYLLRVYRVDGRDAHDPQFRKALEMLNHDPELARWFAREQALDIRLAAKFRAFPVPSDLKNQLLAARKLAPRPTGWRRPAWFSAAAAVALLIFLGALWLTTRGSRQFEQFRNAMVQASMDMEQHVSVKDLDLANARQWLAEHGGRVEFPLPAGLRDHPKVGCRIVEWRGHKVSLLCFQLNGGQHVDLFVIAEKDLPGLLRSSAPQFAMRGDVTTASWRYDGYLYVMAGQGSKADLERLL